MQRFQGISYKLFFTFRFVTDTGRMSMDQELWIAREEKK